MASENDLPPTQPTGQRRRPSAVIDVTATEIKSESPTAGATPNSQQQSHAAGDGASQSSATESRENAASVDTLSKWATLQPYLGGGIAGAISAVLLFAAFLLIRTLTPDSPALPDLTPRLVAIEQRLTEISTRPPPPAADPKTLQDVATRLSRMEAALATPRAPVTDPVVLGRLTTVENAAKSQADNLAALTRRMDSLDSALRETNGQIEKLAALLNELQIRTREARAGVDRASRLAATAAALRDAVERGGPYAAELALVKPLASDATAIAALEPFAATGVPNPSNLGQELAAILRPMLRAAGEVPRDGSYLERLQAGASKLVRISPVGDARGDDRVATLSRIEQRAVQGNIAGALTELSKLSPDARAPSQRQIEAWVTKAEARQRAIEASRRLAADAIAALKASP